tara:strand:- start:1886 stop:2200 length:315 start_codon:yes stop_codon:yes gene_type:complete
MAKEEICIVKVGEIINDFIDSRGFSIEDKIRKNRRYKKTRERIEKFGYDACKYGHIIVDRKRLKHPRPTEEQPYAVNDGNHRVLILKDLYGPNYEVQIKDITNE